MRWRGREKEMDDAGYPPRARGALVDRFITVNATHATYAADRVGTRDDLCEHGLVLLSIDLSDTAYPVSVATRLALSDEHNEDLDAVLASLTRFVAEQTAEARKSRRSYDPRTPVLGAPAVVGYSQPLSPSMSYVGVGVSTLDTPEQPWRQMKGSVEKNSGLHLRGQGYLYLADGTIVHFVRSAQVGWHAGRHTSSSNRLVHSGLHRVGRDYAMRYQADQRTSRIWQGLQSFHEVLQAATTR